jgi:hypothetical protein
MSPLDRVRRIALALPGVNERTSHGEPCFFVRDKRPLCYFHDNHNGDGRISLWCPVPDGGQEEMVSAEPERFLRRRPRQAACPRDDSGCFSTRRASTGSIGEKSPLSLRTPTDTSRPRVWWPNLDSRSS